MQSVLPLEIWLPFSTGTGLGEWREWLLAFLSCREGDVGAEPQSSFPGRFILELNPGRNVTKNVSNAHQESVHVYLTHTRH